MNKLTQFFSLMLGGLSLFSSIVFVSLYDLAIAMKGDVIFVIFN